MTFTFSDTTLDNGLRIVAEHADSAVTAAIGFFVKTGSRDEPTPLMGMSHFLEHMVFKGTPKLSAEEVDLAFDSIGVEHNAFTSGEMTAYWGAGLPEVLGELQDTLAEILKPSLRQEDFDNEKKVILEEIAMYDDQPFWVLYENAMQHYYGDHPLGHRVLGTNQTVQDMQRDSLMEYFTQRYGADNIIVAMAGKLDFEAMVDRITTHCGSWKGTGADREYTQFERHGGEFKQTIEDLHQHYLMMVMPSPSFQDDRKYAAAALGSILGGGDGSRLHWALVDAGLAEAASASADASDKYGEQLAWAVCDKENAGQVAEIMRNEMEGVVSSLTKGDLDRVVAKAGTGAAIGAERPSGRMQRLGSMVITSNEYISLEEELKHIESLTIKNLAEVAEEFPWTPLLTATTTS